MSLMPSGQTVRRRLTENEKSTLTASLLGQPSGQLVIKAATGASDAYNYARDIAAFLQGLGWQIRIDNAIMSGSDMTGLWLTIKDQNAVPLATTALQPL